MIRYLPVLALAALTIYSVLDVMRYAPSEVRGLPRGVWVLVIIIFPAVGPIAWFLAGRPESPLGPPSAPPAPRGPIGPDDDPDFLRRL